MINKLKAKNFQIHRDIEVDFNSPINFLVGVSDRGKSAIFRMIRWMALNKPRGDSFRTHGTKETEVELTTPTGVIKRFKSRTRNDYFTPDGESTNFGNTIPPDAQKHLNLTDINFQCQFDAPFLLSDTPGEVGRKMSEYVNFDVLDDVQKVIKSDIKKYNDAMEDALASVKLTNTKLSTLPDEDTLNNECSVIEELQNGIDSSSTTQDALITAFEKIKQTHASITKYGDINAPLAECVDILALSEKIDDTEMLELIRIRTKSKETQERIDSLSFVDTAIREVAELIPVDSALVNQLNAMQKSMRNLEDTENQIRSLSFVEDALADVATLVDETPLLVDEYVAISKYKENIGVTVQKTKTIDTDIAHYTDVLDRELKTCPLCGRSDER